MRPSFSLPPCGANNCTHPFPQFIITAPDVFKSPVSDTYVIFGEAKPEDASGMAAANAAEQFASRNQGSAAGSAAARPSQPSIAEEVSDSPSGGEFLFLCTHPFFPARTHARHFTLAGGRGDDQARQSDLL